MSGIVIKKVRAGLYKIDGWHVEKRGSYWGIFDYPSHPPRFACKTLAQAEAWITRIGHLDCVCFMRRDSFEVVLCAVHEADVSDGFR